MRRCSFWDLKLSFLSFFLWLFLRSTLCLWCGFHFILFEIHIFLKMWKIFSHFELQLLPILPILFCISDKSFCQIFLHVSEILWFLIFAITLSLCGVLWVISLVLASDSLIISWAVYSFLFNPISSFCFQLLWFSFLVVPFGFLSYVPS